MAWPQSLVPIQQPGDRLPGAFRAQPWQPQEEETRGPHPPLPVRRSDLDGPGMLAVWPPGFLRNWLCASWQPERKASLLQHAAMGHKLGLSGPHPREQGCALAWSGLCRWPLDGWSWPGWSPVSTPSLPFSPQALPWGLDMVESQTWSLAFLFCPLPGNNSGGVEWLKLNLCRAQSRAAVPGWPTTAGLFIVAVGHSRSLLSCPRRGHPPWTTLPGVCMESRPLNPNLVFPEKRWRCL